MPHTRTQVQDGRPPRTAIARVNPKYARVAIPIHHGQLGTHAPNGGMVALRATPDRETRGQAHPPTQGDWTHGNKVRVLLPFPQHCPVLQLLKF